MSDYAYAWRNGPRWAWEDLRYRRNVVCFLRTLWYALMLGHIGETCQECGRPYSLWHSDDVLYSKVTGIGDGTYLASGLFCLDCFDRKARAKGITLRWKPEDADKDDITHPSYDHDFNPITVTDAMVRKMDNLKARLMDDDAINTSSYIVSDEEGLLDENDAVMFRRAFRMGAMDVRDFMEEAIAEAIESLKVKR